MTWRVNSETALLLGGGRALLMQLAHPLVAAGVAHHSDFRTNPLPRLTRTMELTLALVFGTVDDAMAAARSINGVHRRVHGHLEEATITMPAGTPYSAGDKDLLLWVHATLVDSAIATYEAFVGPLTVADREAYYRESQVVGRLLGIAASDFPPDHAAFAAYVAERCRSLEVTDQARGLAHSVLHPPLRRVPRLAFWPHGLVTAGLLHPDLRSGYGLAWGPGRRTAWRITRVALRFLVARLPRWLRIVQPARVAMRRWAPSGRESQGVP